MSLNCAGISAPHALVLLLWFALDGKGEEVTDKMFFFFLFSSKRPIKLLSSGGGKMLEGSGDLNVYKIKMKSVLRLNPNVFLRLPAERKNERWGDLHFKSRSDAEFKKTNWKCIQGKFGFHWEKQTCEVPFLKIMYWYVNVWTSMLNLWSKCVNCKAYTHYRESNFTFVPVLPSLSFYSSWALENDWWFTLRVNAV